MPAPTAARHRKMRERKREKKRQAEDRAGGIFDVSLRPQIPVSQPQKRIMRRKKVAIPDLRGSQLAENHVAVIRIWQKASRPRLSVVWKGLSRTFSEFIAVPDYYHIWRRAFHKANAKIKELSRNVEDGYFVRSAMRHWREWIVTREDEEIFEEHGWEKGEEGERQALVMVLKQIFAAELESEADQIISTKMESTAHTMNHLRVAGPSGRGQEKEEALGMLECLNAFGMAEEKNADTEMTEKEEDAEMDDMKMVE